MCYGIHLNVQFFVFKWICIEVLHTVHSKGDPPPQPPVDAEIWMKCTGARGTVSCATHPVSSESLPRMRAEKRYINTVDWFPVHVCNLWLRPGDVVSLGAYGVGCGSSPASKHLPDSTRSCRHKPEVPFGHVQEALWAWHLQMLKSMDKNRRRSRDRTNMFKSHQTPPPSSAKSSRGYLG